MQAAEDRRKRLRIMRQEGVGGDAVQTAPGEALMDAAYAAPQFQDEIMVTST